MEHFKIEVKYKTLPKDGDIYYFDFVNIWANTRERALSMARKLWHTKFEYSDLVLLETAIC